MSQLTPKEILEIESSVIDDARKNDEMTLRVAELRDTTRSRLITLALAIGAIVVPILSASDPKLDRHGLRLVVVLLSVAVIVAIVGRVIENVASTRTSPLATARDAAAMRQLVAWLENGSAMPPAKETSERIQATRALQQSQFRESLIYGFSDLTTVMLIVVAMLKMAGVFIWSGL